MNRTRTRAWSSRSSGTPCPRWSSTISTSTPRWKPVSRSMPWPSIMAGPRRSALKELINCYIEHRREVVIRRTRFELRKAEERAETLEGYLIALANLDEFIRIIRQSGHPRGGQDQAAGLRLHARAGGAHRHSHPQRSAADQRALFLQRSAGQRHPGAAPLPIDRAGNGQGPGRIHASCSSGSRTCSTSWPRKPASWPSSRPSCGRSRRSTPRRA